MTQENSHRPTRRAARAGRNRPELVTSKDGAKSAAPLSEMSQSSEETMSASAEEPAASPSPRRRLASFFSTVGRGQQTAAAQETDVAQARLARATRGKAPAPAKDSQKSETQEPTKATTPARTAPTRPASPFKRKYLIGIAIYLFGAQFIGMYEQQFLKAYHLEGPLAHLFGFTITTSTLAFLATLLVLLLLLARFDLIPRNFGAMSGRQQSSQTGRSNSQDTSEGNVKHAPPTMKQGVKGADDDLYQEYRANQRRAKKR